MIAALIAVLGFVASGFAASFGSGGGARDTLS
jgi:hypothetical protein